MPWASSCNAAVTTSSPLPRTVAQVDHLGPHALQDAAHDVDRRIMAVKQAGRRDKTHFVGGAVIGQSIGIGIGIGIGGQVGHGVVSIRIGLDYFF